MNNSVMKFTIMCAAAMISVSTFAAGINLKGSGKVITRTQPVAAYDAIEASRAVRVIVEERTGGDAIIEADDNAMQYVKVEVDGGTLKVGFDKRVNGVSDIHVKVRVPYCEGLNSLDASSAASIVVEPTIKGESLTVDAGSAAHVDFAKAEVTRCAIDVSSAAKVSGAVKSDRCEVEASSASNTELAMLTMACTVETSSASKVVLSGEAGIASLDVSSASKIDASELNARKASADVSSGASIKVNSSRELDAKASSGGSIRYKGPSTLALTSTTSSGGSVSRQ